MRDVLLAGLVVVVVGLVVGRLCGGRLRFIGDCRVRSVWLLWLAAAGSALQWWASVWLIMPFVLVGVWVVLNLRGRPPLVRLSLVGALAGLTMNGAAIMANGRMPYAVDAARAAGLATDVELVRNTPATASIALPWLADALPVPGLRMVISAGDVVLAVALCVLICGLMMAQEKVREEEVRNG